MNLEDHPVSPGSVKGERSPLSRSKEYNQVDRKETRREAQKSKESSVDDSKREGGDGSVQNSEKCLLALGSLGPFI